MERRQLEYFVAVVDHGGFTRAADALRVAQPSLSQSVAALERELGTPLFHRLSRRVVLTAAGRALLEPARQILRDHRVALEAVRAVRGLAAGTLDLAVIPTLAAHPLAGLIGRFVAHHPGVRVQVRDLEPGQDVEDAVLTGDCEIGLTELPQQDPRLLSRALGVQEFHLVLPPGSRRRASVGPAALGGLSLVATPPGTSSRAALDSVLAAGGVAEPRIVVTTAHREALTPLVLAGVGAALLPAPMAEQAQALGAVTSRLRPAVTRSVGLLHRAGAMSPAAAAFLELV